MKFVWILLAVCGTSWSAANVLAADTQPPSVHFIYPTEGMTLGTNWAAVHGNVVDEFGGSGVDEVTVSILAPDGRFWDGTGYVNDPVLLSTVITNGTNWARIGGLPIKNDLQVGDYTIFATASDMAGNLIEVSIAVTMNVPPPPPNDDFVNSQLLTGVAGSVQGTTAGATREPGEPNHAFINGVASIWYRWTAPDRGILTLDTTGSAFDTLLAVYTGSTVSNLTYVESDHGGGQFGGSRLGLTTVAGRTYYIAVDGRDGFGANSYGNSTLAWTLAVSQPTLKIAKTNSTNVVISWTAAAQGFNLHTTPSLSPLSWVPSAAPVRQGDAMVVTVPSSNTTAFFRLQKP